MRRPLERRVIAFCSPRFVLTRFAVAFDAEMLVTTENEAMGFLRESQPASLPARSRPNAASDRKVIAIGGDGLNAWMCETPDGDATPVRRPGALQNCSRLHKRVARSRRTNAPLPHCLIAPLPHWLIG